MHTTRSGSLQAGVFARRRALSVIGLLLLMVGFLTATPATANASSGWELILDRPPPGFGGMDFVSPDEGWVAGAGLFHTTDGCATWEEAVQLSGTDVDFADADYGWLVGSGIYATTDGGETWSKQTSGTNIPLSDVFALSPSEAFAVGSSEGFGDLMELPFASALIHTTDGGTTWSGIELPPGAWFNEIIFSGNSGWAAGDRCPSESESSGCHPTSAALLRTSDRGATWESIELDASLDRLHSLNFLDESTGWAVGVSCGQTECEASVIATKDGGLTWEPTGSPAGTIEDLVVQDEMNAWAVTQTCEFQVDNCELRIQGTNDGGDNWTGLLFRRARFRTRAALHINAGNVYIPSDVLRSTDGGTTFEPMQHPGLFFRQVEFVNSNVGFAVDGASIFRTDDAGRSWRTVGPSPGSASDIVFLSQTTGFAIVTDCCQGFFEVHRTVDGGASWQAVYSSTSFRLSSLQDAHFSGDRGWFVLDEGVLVTEDGGLTWAERLLEDSGRRFVDAALAGAESAWAILEPVGFGEPLSLVRTEDRGQTWIEVTTPVEAAWGHRIEASDELHAWFTTTICETEDCSFVPVSSSNGGKTWEETTPGAGQTLMYDLTFTDPLHGWMSSQSGSCSGCTTAVSHTADGGRTWHNQLRDDYVSGDKLYLGSFDFVDNKTGWFLLSSTRGFGPGGGPPNRTQLYHTTDGGGGTVGVPPTPTIQLPKVGTDVPNGGSHLLSFALVVGGLGLSLSAAGMAAARSARRP